MKRFLRHPVLTDRRKRFRIPRILLGLLAGIIPFFLIFRRIDPENLFSALATVKWWALPALLFFSLLAMALQGTRWWILIRAFTRELTWPHSLSLHFSSSFYSLFLPNSTMQEVVRSVVATKHIGSVISWSSAWVNKITGIFVSFSISAIGILFLRKGLIPAQAVTALWILFGGIVVAGALSFSKTVTRPLWRMIRRVLPAGVAAFAAQLHEGVYQFRNKKRFLAATLLVTVCVQFSIVMAITLLIYGITGHFYPAACLAFVPLIEIISVTQPFTPNGMGVREALVAIMFSQLGLSHEQLGVYIVLSNMSILLRLIGAGPACVNWLKGRQRK